MARRPVRKLDFPSCVDRPRERLTAFGAAALSDAELLALLLRTGAPSGDALAIATSLLEAHGGLHGLARAGGPELAASAGIGPAKSATVCASLELGRRLAARRLQPGAAIRGRVLDAGGAPVAGQEVQLTAAGFGVTPTRETSDDAGRFDVHLPEGEYAVWATARREGRIWRGHREGIELCAQGAVHVNLEMEMAHG